MKKEFKTAFNSYSAYNVLGEGGAGIVYEAKDEEDNVYAIKVLNFAKATKENLKRFKNEHLFCSKNEHKNIITMVDAGNYIDGDKSTSFVVMPKYECSLRKVIKDLKLDDILSFFSQILDGVEAAHLIKVYHRDLKPENILVDFSKKHLVIADFGIAHFEENEIYTLVETKLDKRLANFQYAAPEQRQVGGIVDYRADIYALGLILNEMFTSEIPQGTDYKTIKSVNPEYGYLDELVAQMIKQNPKQRPVSIAQIKQELIGRKNQFISLQKLSELKKKVIPVSEIEDSLIADPPSLIDADWDGSQLYLKLSCEVNQTWKEALENMGNFSYMQGKEPGRFNIRGAIASISANENEVEDLVKYFKSWIPKANTAYKDKLEREMREREQRQRLNIERQIIEKETIERVRKRIKV